MNFYIGKYKGVPNKVYPALSCMSETVLANPKSANLIYPL